MSGNLRVDVIGSTSIRQVTAVQDGGNYRNVTFLFVKGGGETHGFVVGEDLDAVLNAKSVGTHYWRVFRKKYKTPLKVEPEPIEDDDEDSVTPLCTMCGVPGCEGYCAPSYRW